MENCPEFPQKTAHRPHTAQQPVLRCVSERARTLPGGDARALAADSRQDTETTGVSVGRGGAHGQWAAPRPQKNDKLPSATTWTDPEGVTLSEMSQTGKDERHMISLTCGIRKTKHGPQRTCGWASEAVGGRGVGMRSGVNGTDPQVQEKYVLGCDGQRRDRGPQTPPQTEPRRQLQRARPPAPSQERAPTPACPGQRKSECPSVPFLSPGQQGPLAPPPESARNGVTSCLAPAGPPARSTPSPALGRATVTPRAGLSASAPAP